MPRSLRSVVIGAGFAGLSHVDAVRRGGFADVVALVGPESPRLRASAMAAGVERVEVDPSAVFADPAVGVVHVCTPNRTHAELARAALEAGKHVVVEKPLAMSVAEATGLVSLADRVRRHAMVPFTYRGYATAGALRELVRGPGIGALRLVHGRYLQDWLADESDYNWRIDPAESGASRAVADIGSHWFDMAEWVTGDRVESVLADLATFLPYRDRPLVPARAFETASGPTERVPVESEDAGLVLLRFRSGARGSCVLSQVSLGHKNDFRMELDGAERSAWWHQEDPERLWVASRDGVEGRWRTPGPVPAGPPHLPQGHVEGWGDALRDVLRPFYAAVAAGSPPPAPGREADAAYPTLSDGLRAAVFVEACVRSARESRWVRLDEVVAG
jgi:predicted dehydrogenase